MKNFISSLTIAILFSISSGIIKATEASFINNTVAVKIDPVNELQIAYK